MNKNLLKYSLLSTLLISLTFGDYNCAKSCEDDRPSSGELQRMREL